MRLVAIEIRASWTESTAPNTTHIYLQTKFIIIASMKCHQILQDEQSWAYLAPVDPLEDAREKE